MDPSSLRFLGLGPGEAHRLLSLCGSRPAPPVLRLLERLEEADGASWARRTLSEAVAEVDGGRARSGADIVISGAGGVAACSALKRVGKRAMKSDGDPAEAALLYISAVAAAMAHHGEQISSQEPRGLATRLAEVAPLLDADLADVFWRAAAWLGASDA